MLLLLRPHCSSFVEKFVLDDLHPHLIVSGHNNDVSNRIGLTLTLLVEVGASNISLFLSHVAGSEDDQNNNYKKADYDYYG